MKLIKSFALIFVLALTLNAKDNTQYLCFELKGDMGKELKALVEKYYGDIKEADIKTITPSSQQGRFANFDIDKTYGVDKTAMVERGKEIYQRTCQSCHGLNGEIKAYGKSRALNTLTESQMDVAIIGYKNNTYDRGAAIVMKPHANMLTSSDIKDIAAYIEFIKKNPVEVAEDEKED